MSTTKTDLQKAIHQKRLACLCLKSRTAELCPSQQCALWPFRFAKDPYKTPLTEKQREARLNALSRARDTKSVHTQEGFEG